MHKTKSGFTLVELLVVVIVIAILATISVTAYNGAQQRARIAKATTDLKTLEKAIILGRTYTKKTLYQITGSGCTYCGGDTEYAAALDKITAASGIDLSSLKKGDPWNGNRYLINENEGEYAGDPCHNDEIWVAGGIAGAPDYLIPMFAC